MEKVLQIKNIWNRETYYSYWENQSDISRQQTTELLHQQYINFNKNVQSRLQKVCRIVNQA